MVGLVSSGLLVNRKTRLHLDGSIRKTRIAALSPTRSLVVLDFRAANPSDYLFVVKTVEVEVTRADGTKEVGQFIPEIDAKTLFAALPGLGEQRAVSVATGEHIDPKQSVDRMAAASFLFPESELNSNRSIVLRIHDVDGPVAEIR